MKILSFFLLALLLSLYGVVEFTGGRIFTSLYGDKFPPYKITVDDVDLRFSKEFIVVQNIGVFRRGRARIGTIDSMTLAPTWKKQTINFSRVLVDGARFAVSAADVPTNMEKNKEPLPLVPRFGTLKLKGGHLQLIGVAGINGDKFLTLRNIRGDVDCQSSELCLENAFTLKAVPMKGSLAIIDGDSDLRKEKQVHVRGALKGIRLSVFNQVLSNASPVMAKSGRVDLFTEYSLSGTSGKGYLKFFIENLELEEKKNSTARTIAKLAGSFMDNRKIDHFDIRIPVVVKNNKFSLEEVDVKQEIERIVDGRMLPKGFDTPAQAQEAKDDE